MPKVNRWHRARRSSCIRYLWLRSSRPGWSLSWIAFVLSWDAPWLCEDGLEWRGSGKHCRTALGKRWTSCITFMWKWSGQRSHRSKEFKRSEQRKPPLMLSSPRCCTRRTLTRSTCFRPQICSRRRRKRHLQPGGGWRNWRTAVISPASKPFRVLRWLCCRMWHHRRMAKKKQKHCVTVGSVLQRKVWSQKSPPCLNKSVCSEQRLPVAV